jgi:Ni/Co efflux regulator RcnB
MNKLIFTCIATALVAAPMATVVKAEETTIIKRDSDRRTGGWRQDGHQEGGGIEGSPCPAHRGEDDHQEGARLVSSMVA